VEGSTGQTMPKRGEENGGGGRFLPNVCAHEKNMVLLKEKTMNRKKDPPSRSRESGRTTGKRVPEKRYKR